MIQLFLLIYSHAYFEPHFVVYNELVSYRNGQATFTGWTAFKVHLIFSILSFVVLSNDSAFSFIYSHAFFDEIAKQLALPTRLFGITVKSNRPIVIRKKNLGW